MGGIAGIDIIQLGEHGYHGGRRHGGHDGQQHHDLIGEAEQVGDQQDDHGEEKHFERAEIIDIFVAEDLLGGSGRQKRSRDQHGDGGAKITQIGEKIPQEEGDGHAGNCLRDVECYADQTGDGAEIDQNLFRCQLDVGAFAGIDGNAPSPEREVEADNETHYMIENNYYEYWYEVMIEKKEVR